MQLGWVCWTEDHTDAASSGFLVEIFQPEGIFHLNIDDSHAFIWVDVASMSDVGKSTTATGLSLAVALGRSRWRCTHGRCTYNSTGAIC